MFYWGSAAYRRVMPAPRCLPGLLGTLFLAGVLAPTRAQDAAPPSDLPRVVLQTSLGNIEIALDTSRAPVTAGNFLRYVDEKRLDGSTFYRAVKVGDEGAFGLVQGGLRGDPKRVLPPIAHEAPSATGLSHKEGAVSMAHLQPGTATADFFIVVGDLVSLDGTGKADDPGYAVFGRVVSGMDLVKSILVRPRSEEAPDPGMKGQMLAEPVKIYFARRAGEEAK